MTYPSALQASHFAAPTHHTALLLLMDDSVLTYTVVPGWLEALPSVRRLWCQLVPFPFVLLLRVSHSLLEGRFWFHWVARTFRIPPFRRGRIIRCMVGIFQLLLVRWNS